jgi:MFS family permease
VLHTAAATVLTPGIAALTLRVSGHAGFGGQLGSNTRWASLGSAGAAALFGVVASSLSERAVFLVAAALMVPALLALTRIEPATEAAEPDHPALLHPSERRRRKHRFWRIYLHLHLHCFALCMVLFGLANAAMLPFALNALAERGRGAGLIVSAALIVSQLVAALISPRFGRLAQSWGRRPLLLIGFGMLPVRGVLLALFPDAPMLIATEVLDGVSAAVIGIMLPLLAADLTRHTGFLNLAIGSFGLAAGLGATVSTVVAGWLVDQAGVTATLFALAAAGAAGFALVWAIIPETRPALARDPVAAVPGR